MESKEKTMRDNGRYENEQPDVPEYLQGAEWLLEQDDALEKGVIDMPEDEKMLRETRKRLKESTILGLSLLWKLKPTLSLGDYEKQRNDILDNYGSSMEDYLNRKFGEK
jgi:hypothetical protein